MSSGIAIIKVGGSTEIEMIEKKHRVEDSLESVNSAQLEGIICGGGQAFIKVIPLLNISCENHSQRCGVKVIKYAIQEPFKQILKNADLLVDFIPQKEWNIGLDATDGTYKDLIKSGIIDPYKVLRVSLENAASCATTLFTSCVGILET